MEYYKFLRNYVGHQPIILPGSLIIIVNKQDEILLQYRTEGTWGLPGGLMELGESLTDTARREVLEETGLLIGELELIDIFSGPEYFYRIVNGDEFYSVTALYQTSDYSGELKINDDESKELQFFNSNEIPDQMSKEYKDAIKVYLKRQGHFAIKFKEA